MNYVISIEKHGILHKAGTLHGTDHNDMCFDYDADYLTDPDAHALSISLPLQKEPFDPVRTRTFFEGMLPEGFIRHTLADRMHIDDNDYPTMLCNLGRECLGAVRITGDNDPISEGYTPIGAREIARLASEGATRSTDIVAKTHLSLTGASGKVGLYYDEETGTWYLPEGTAPSTHIVKQSHVRLNGIVTNEQLAMLTAAKCGIETANSFIINTGNASESEVLYATKRYDRAIDDSSRKINSLKRPYRLHQEDFAQALNIPSSRKYEGEYDHYLSGMFNILRNYSSDPLDDQLKLWDRIVFNSLIGNTDSHIKNFSLLYSSDMRSIRLAPAYDIISTVIYESSTRDLSMKIGGATTIDDITRDSFIRAASEAGIGSILAMKHYDSICNIFENALRESASELAVSGFTIATDICEQILVNNRAL